MAKLKTETRPIRNRAGSFNVIGLFWSRQLRRHVVYESLAERSLFVRLEHLKTRYQEQPREFRLWLDGMLKSYTPDAESPDVDGQVVLYQVKPKDKAADPEFQRLMDAFEPQLLAMGYRHIVFSPEAYSDTYWLNIQVLYGYAKRHMDAIQLKAAFDVLSHRQEWRLSEAIEAIRLQGFAAGLVYTNIFDGAVTFDVEQPLAKKTVLQVGSGPER